MIDVFDYKYLAEDLARLSSVIACAEPVKDGIVVSIVASGTNDSGDVISIKEQYANTLGLVSGILVNKEFVISDSQRVKIDHPLYPYGTYSISGNLYIFRTDRLEHDLNELADAVDMLQILKEEKVK